MDDPALELRDLGCMRGGRALFSGLNLRLPLGRLVRVTGANGSGKTSLLRMVCGLLRPTCGEVLWRGRRIGALREEFHRELAYLGHSAGLKEDLSAIENLLAAARLAGANPGGDQTVVALSGAGLSHHEQRMPVRSLSQGQRKRVALSRLAVCGDAALWVLDEPFEALDGIACGWLFHLVTTHVGRGGLVLLTDHQLLPALPPAMARVNLALGEVAS
ncbi:cytochrome c biogenesis heme-transporting ATPase CcmA [Variovorax sp. GT1P44]|uniref:cytochrome c biogenesis heme-transporting ATPase CcmA n=1 Tax=Variovorax sp. GT1P44 TaxID=3443742 RepID=UPI003F472661